MIKITRYFYVHWSFFLLAALSYFAGGLYTMLAAYAVVAVHELFHLFAALLVRERIGCMILLPFGMTLRLSAGLVREPAKEIFIALAGPFSNILMLFLADIAESYYGFGNLAVFTFRILNLSTLAVNILPCLPLDGGRALRALLVRHLGYLSAVSVMKRISRTIIIILGALGIILVLVSGLNMSLLMAVAFLAFQLSAEQRRNEYILMQEILYEKDKLRKKGYMRSGSISVTEDTYARDVFKLLGYDSFYIIHIVNKELKLRRSVTEAQLVDAILEKGWQTTLSEVF
ncbi:MAG: hypothetical protein IKL80_02015 [Clostridia bacterium]|nr:hypothetical protein [Clostridia bacterium]